MVKQTLLLVISLVLGQSIFAQGFDTTTYRRLLDAGKDDFVSVAKAAGLDTAYDTASQTLFAKTKGCIYTKPLGDKNNNENYDLALIVSTLNKENNKLILANATEAPNKKGTWTDPKHLYLEWDTENPVSKEKWYKVIVYRKKR
jgi:hypothetical protein